MSIAFDNPSAPLSRTEIEPIALDLIRRRGAEVMGLARHYADNPDDAEDAYQRALEILLTKAPSADEAHLLAWVKTVVKHEAFALRRARARTVPAEESHIEALAGPVDGVAEDRAESLDRLRLGAEALQRLKPQETKALLLRAEGLSYAEICSQTGWSYTKVNRCVAEGRKAFVERVRGIESGAECERLAPLVSRLADGEASAEDMLALRPHLRGCSGCRALLRDYREAPRQVAAVLGPAVLVGAGGSAGSLTDPFHAFAGWLGERAATAMFRFQSLWEAAAASKAAVVAASTVAIAGGGVAAVDQMHAPPRPEQQAAVVRPASEPAAAAKPEPQPKQAAAVAATASTPTDKPRQESAGSKKRSKRPAASKRSSSPNSSTTGNAPTAPQHEFTPSGSGSAAAASSPAPSQPRTGPPAPSEPAPVDNGGEFAP